LNVLKGAQKLIESKSINIIAFEFNMMNIVKRVFLKDFINILPGYSFYRLLQDGLIPLSYNNLQEIFAYQNIIAIRTGFIQK
jgi:hypothetical protein